MNSKSDRNINDHISRHNMQYKCWYWIYVLSLVGGLATLFAALYSSSG